MALWLSLLSVPFIKKRKQTQHSAKKLQNSNWNETWYICDNNWFLGSRKVYEPLVTISGGKIYQTFLQLGSWTWLEISTMAHDYEISPSIPIFKNEERTLYIHYKSWSSPLVLPTNDPLLLEQSCLSGKQRYFRKVQVAKLVTIMSKTKWMYRQFTC